MGESSDMSSVPQGVVDEVKRLQCELRETQCRLQSVADASGSLFGKLEFELRDGDDLVLVGADTMADQLLGKVCAPFLGQPFLSLLPGLNVTDIPAGLREVAARGGVLGPQGLPGEGYLSGKAFNFFAFQVTTGRVIVKFWDSSGALDPEKLGMRSQQQLAVVFSQSPMAISLSRERDGVYVDANEEWTRLTGLSLQDVLGRTSIEFGFWTDAAHRQATLTPLYKTGRLRDLNLPFVRPDGTKIIVQLSVARIEIGGSTYFLSYLQDVTADRANQAALLASEQLHKATGTRLNRQIGLFESMESLASVGYWTAGVEPGSLRWSNGLYSLTGFAPGSVVDTVAGRSGIHAEDRKRFEDARDKVDGSTVEYRWHHPDGRIHWLRSRMRRWAEDGAGVLDFGVVQDVTVEREAALALQERLGFIQKITGSVPGVVFQLRLKPDGSYQFPYISDSVRELYRGVTPEEVMRDASSTLALHHPEDLENFVASIRTSARNLTPWSHEYRLLFADGEVRWLQGQAITEREPNGSVLWNGFTTNITARKLAEENLRESEARFRDLTALSSDWYWEQDTQFRFVRVDGNLAPANIRSAESYIGNTRWDFDAEGVSEAQWAVHRAGLEAHETFHDFEFQRRRQDGTLMWVSICGTPIFDAQGVFKGYRGIGRDVSEHKRVEQEIERLAFYDVLTGLPNRRLLLDRLQHAMFASGRDHSPGALLFIDLDNFKDLNDTQGHDMGDKLLKQVAIRLGECVREADTVARLGGDEFVVLLEKLSANADEAATQAEAVGRKILATLNQPYRMADNEHHSTPSIGITLFHDHLTGIDELLKRADLAMYQSKAAGRNTLRFFDPAMQAVVAARAAMESDLRQGLQRKELILFYQPVVNETGCVLGYEALARWTHPQRGMVMPSDFIPLAEQSGLILPLGQWVLETACMQLVAWSAQPHTACLSLAVNVSVRQFRQADFAIELLALLQCTGANPERLKLEITESLLVNDMEDAIRKMDELRAIGVSFSLDDFGTGYSSLAYLKKLSLEQLKIDQSFVRDVTTSASDAAIAQTVLTLGQSLGLTVIAEGVETPAQFDFLLRQGCRMFQGYLFGRPLPLDQLELDGPGQPTQVN